MPAWVPPHKRGKKKTAQADSGVDGRSLAQLEQAVKEQAEADVAQAEAKLAAVRKEVADTATAAATSNALAEAMAQVEAAVARKWENLPRFSGPAPEPSDDTQRWQADHQPYSTTQGAGIESAALGMDPSDSDIPNLELFRCFPGLNAGEATCRAVPVASARRFGPFAEKTLVCNLAARRAIDTVCRQGGFTQAWAKGVIVGTGGEDLFTMTKIPAIILVKLMLLLPVEHDAAVQSLTGAYAICMDPEIRTCMNVVVGRRPNGSGGFVLDKFSLYYPNNASIPAEWGNTWDLLQGYSFRTAALSGSLNRAGLRGIALDFPCAAYGLVIDDDSAYEDCAYVQSVPGESDEVRVARITSIVNAMVAAFGGNDGCLAASYDPAEQQRGLTALEGEWNLLLKVVGADCAPDGSPPELPTKDNWASIASDHPELADLLSDDDHEIDEAHERSEVASFSLD